MSSMTVMDSVRRSATKRDGLSAALIQARDDLGKRSITIFFELHSYAVQGT